MTTITQGADISALRTAAQVTGDFLALSDERDQWSAWLRAAEAAAYERGRASVEGEYERGFTDGVLTVKAAQHGIVTDLRQHLITWNGLREDFGKPRPGDYPGKKVV